eukprot:gene26932-18898_t
MEQFEEFLSFYRAELELRNELPNERRQRAAESDEESVARGYWLVVCIGSRRKEDRSDSTTERRSLLAFKTNADVVQYGDMLDYELIVMTQMLARSWLARKHFQELCKKSMAARKIQKVWRMHVSRMHFNNMLAANRRVRQLAAKIIQVRWRGYWARKCYQIDRARVLRLQRFGQGQVWRERLYRFRCAMFLVQRVGRGSLGRKRAKHVQRVRAALTTQCGWRCYVARKELSHLKYRKRCCMLIQRL